MQSTIPYSLTNNASPKLTRSYFDRSHGYKTTFNAGEIIPFYLDEVLPGDTFNLKATLFGRLSTPYFPIMDNIFLDSFFFFVPRRLVWSNFEKQMGQQDNPADSVDYTTPVIDNTSFTSFNTPSGLTLWDYFGLPTSRS